MCDKCKPFIATTTTLIEAAIEELTSGTIPHRDEREHSPAMLRQFARYSLMMSILKSEASEQGLNHIQAWAMMTGWVAQSTQE